MLVVWQRSMHPGMVALPSVWLVKLMVVRMFSWARTAARTVTTTATTYVWRAQDDGCNIRGRMSACGLVGIAQGRGKRKREEKR